jgi:arsenite methyltransferase
VIGVDMTSEQLEMARRHEEYHRKEFGYSSSNVKFVQGYIEDLSGAGIEAESIDLVVSNCVTNLSPDKPQLFREIWKALKPGGELYFSDVFVDRRLPAHCAEDPVLLGECLGAAMHTEDFRRLMAELGCPDIRRISSTPMTISDPVIAAKLGNARFQSITFRAFKVPLEDRCEDFGQVAVYRGTVVESPHSFLLDDHHLFVAGKPMLVCGNTAAMISAPAYREHFVLTGDQSTHYGLFDCGPAPLVGGMTSATSGVCSTGACC